MANLPPSPFFPHWAERVAEMNRTIELKLLAVKKVEASDISEHQNGFILPRDAVEKKLVPNLIYEERDRANLLTIHERRRRDHSDDSSSSARMNYIYDGLNVSVYVEGGWRVELLLTRNDGSGNIVIRGNEFELFRKFGNFKVGDNVAIWMLRHSDYVNNKLKFSFCIVRIDLALIIAETTEYDMRLSVL